MGPAETVTQTKKNIVKAIKDVSEELGNTPAVCRASYIHPAVLKAYESGITISDFRPRAQRSVTKIARLEPEEKALMRLLKSQKRI
jgi:DNA topoisomerase-1